MDDAELIHAARAGQVEAFGSLIERHLPELRGFLALLGVPGGERDELCQDVFVEAFRSLAGFAAERPFGPWLRGIARHQVLAARRRRGRARRAQALGAIAELIHAAEPEPEALAELVAPLRDCLRALSPAARALLGLRYGEDLDATVIAARSGRSADAVRMALGRLRGALRACIRRRVGGSTA